MFLDSLYTFYFLLALVAPSFSFQSIFTQNPLSTNLNYNNFLWLQSSSSTCILAFRVDQKLQNTESCCSTTTSPIWFPAENAGCKLFAYYAASHLLSTTTCSWKKLSCNACVPAVRSTKAWHSSMRTSLSSAGVSRSTLMGCPSYARNRVCAFPSPSPIHYVMAEIVPAM